MVSNPRRKILHNQNEIMYNQLITGRAVQIWYDLHDIFKSVTDFGVSHESDIRIDNEMVGCNA